ncbi:cysteine peptidase family C39 domain-containing protein [Sphingobacterium sp. E70]|nr:cysteine peptidase family C39 domain-containing protein [Sphingobacterium sp. E70]
MDCGPTCLKIITKYFGKTFPLSHFRSLCRIGKQGTSFHQLAEAAQQLGFKTLSASLSYQVLSQQAPLPCILHWEREHYVVLYRITAKFAYLADPAMNGKVKIKTMDFLRSWETAAGTGVGRALLLETSPDFESQASIADPSASVWSLLPLLKDHRKN